MDWPASLRRLFRRKPPTDLALDQCPQCGREMELVERTTFTGDDMRTYFCARCAREYVVDFGMATWQALHNARHPDNKS
ncbi:MAG TPA: hypothetical protein VK432_03735 [Stellaceae bacterium]|nr:hypothetical protein [Stellaceae bacterium]